MTYEEKLRAWLADQKTYQKYSTYTCYANICENHLIPAFGPLPVEAVTTELVQQRVLDWLDHGNLLTGGGLSQSFVRSIITVIKITCPSVGEVKLPYQAPHEVEVFPQHEVLELINHLQMHLDSRGLGVLLALHTGLRIGEICGLKWADIDLQSRTLTVSRTLIRTYTKGDGSRLALTPPKSKSSIRTVPLNTWISHLLGLLAGDPECYVLTGSSKPLEPGKYRAWYNRMLKKLNLPHRKFHTLRHTFATTCIACGSDYKSLSKLLGHASVSTTMDLYVHPEMSLKRQCVESIVKAFSAPEV